MIKININDRGFKMNNDTYTHKATKMDYRLHNGIFQYHRPAATFFRNVPVPFATPGSWVNSGMKKGFQLKHLVARQNMLVQWHYQNCLAQV